MRSTTVESTSVGPIALAYIACDECGKRWADDQLSQTHFNVTRGGIVGHADRVEWDFCSRKCLVEHFQPSTEDEGQPPNRGGSSERS